MAGATRMLDYVAIRMAIAISTLVYRWSEIGIYLIKPIASSDFLFKPRGRADSGGHQQSNNHCHCQRTQATRDDH